MLMSLIYIYIYIGYYYLLPHTKMTNQNMRLPGTTLWPIKIGKTFYYEVPPS